MNIDREKLLAFVKEYEILLDRKKSILSDTKDFIEGFCDENEIEKKKPFLNAVKSYIKFMEDKVKFELETSALDEYFSLLTKE